MLLFAAHTNGPRVARRASASPPEQASRKHIMRVIVCLFVLCLSLRAEAGEMVRVVSVPAADRIIVEPKREVRLAGIEVVDPSAGAALRQLVGVGSWVMIEPAGDGGAWVYRSPDAMLVNRELVLRGLARATVANLVETTTTPMKYLGESAQTGVQQGRPAAPQPAQPRPRATSPRARTGSRSRR